MLVTEGEAKTKWCPFVRQMWARRDGEGDGWRTGDGSSFNAVQISKSDERFRVGECVGSVCMSWRWADPAGPMTSDTGAPIEDPPDPSSRRGYCGLAGKLQR